MAEDWAADVKKFAPDADEGVIAAIVRYCGIALRTPDASLVSFSDPAETGRVRDNYCRKKLGLTDPDDIVDAAIKQVGARMGSDTTRNRVTVYYLLAEHFGKLGLFSRSAAADTGPVAPTGDAVPPAAAASPVMAVASPVAATTATPPAAVTSAAPPLAPAPPPASPSPAMATAPMKAAAVPTVVSEARQGPDGGIMALGCGALLVIVLGMAALATQVRTRPEPAPVAGDAILTPLTETSVSQTATAPVVPDGAGVTTQQVEGKPLVSVYFDTAKTDIAPDFATVAAPVKLWIDDHPGARLAVSGFNDPSGNAAFNAELSKNRAQAVAAALAGIGVPADVIDLEKPPETTDAGTTAAQARRVDIVVKDAA